MRHYQWAVKPVVAEELQLSSVVVSGQLFLGRFEVEDM